MFTKLMTFFLYSFPFFAGMFTPLLAFIGFVIARRRYIEMNKDAVAVKKRGATRMAKKGLKQPNKALYRATKKYFMLNYLAL